jgi:hypothetical protein
VLLNTSIDFLYLRPHRDFSCVDQMLMVEVGCRCFEILLFQKIRRKKRHLSSAGNLVACNSDIGIARMYHEACAKELLD